MTSTRGAEGILDLFDGRERERPHLVERSCPFCPSGAASRPAGSGGVVVLRCARCGFQFVSPSPHEEEVAAQEGSPALEALACSLGLPPLEELARAEQHSAARLLRLIVSLRSSGWMFDAGASTGVLVQLARQHFAVEGSEPSGRRRQLAAARGISLRSGDPRSAVLPSAIFQVGVLHHYLERVLDPLALLESCRSLLAPTGLLFAVTACARPNEHGDAPIVPPSLAALRALSLFNTASLGAALPAAGFRVVDLYSPEAGTLIAIGEPT